MFLPSLPQGDFFFRPVIALNSYRTYAIAVFVNLPPYEETFPFPEIKTFLILTIPPPTSKILVETLGFDMKKTRNVITIKDVAAKAGVAISTVSLVLNNRDAVKDSTRLRVEAAAKELGYVRNSIAASMKTGHTKIIVVIVPDFINDFFTCAVQGITEVATERGYFTLVFATSESPKKEQELFHGEIGQIIDGAILIPSIEDEFFYDGLSKPVVLIDRTVGNLNAVTIDNYKGAYLATKELISAGHTKIAAINGDRDFMIYTNRKRGFEDAMHEHGIPIQERYIKQGEWYQHSGYALTGELLTGDDPPTAIFAANNQISIGCINYLRDHGIQIGQDISLTAFDDSLLARTIRPAVTVIDRPTIEMGRIAAQMLLDILSGNRTEPQQKMLDVKLIRRGSVAKAST